MTNVMSKDNLKKTECRKKSLGKTIDNLIKLSLTWICKQNLTHFSSLFFEKNIKITKVGKQSRDETVRNLIVFDIRL